MNCRKYKCESFGLSLNNETDHIILSLKAFVDRQCLYNRRRRLFVSYYDLRSIIRIRLDAGSFHPTLNVYSRYK